MAELQLNILSPAKVVARTRAVHVLVPGSQGYLGILPGHTRLIAELGVGEMSVDGEGGKKETFFVAGGYVDVANDNVTLLADVIERPQDIDIQRAEKAKSRALDRLDKAAEVDVMRAQAALLRATTRISLVQRGR
jgi:F-type H+-transporting ATPase subunit epsilon